MYNTYLTESLHKFAEPCQLIHGFTFYKLNHNVVPQPPYLMIIMIFLFYIFFYIFEERKKTQFLASILQANNGGPIL